MDGSGIGSYSSSIDGLEAGTTYYVRAYAINTEGAGYGNEINFSTDNNLSAYRLLYLKNGDPGKWTVSIAVYSRFEELRNWGELGYQVVSKDFSTTNITDSLLNQYSTLRLICSSGSRPITDGELIYSWVLNGGCLFVDIERAAQISLVSRFGVKDIEGQAGGSTEWSWYYHGAPWVFGLVDWPYNNASSIAAQAMDHPILDSNHNLTIDASISSYPIVVHGEFGKGKVVIVFAQGWAHDKTASGNAFRATIFKKDNIQFLRDCIKYFSE